MALTFNQVFGIHQHTMRIRNDRAEVIAGNLANADTPGFKARGLDFNAALIEQAHLKTVDSNPPMAKTNVRHLDLGDLPRDPELLLKYRLPYQADTGNGNTVEVSTERMNYMTNNIEYRATLQFLNGRISKLMSALQSGAN
ncbi:MAG TPA: flagellar basal body rod protein FlgB [Candidatus Avisuccinivibrio pullicola]|nr:flagellar basal body rod protein FlgB [Candidatus Avisuccinivibrio pullicola]